MQITPLLLNEYFSSWENANTTSKDKAKKDITKHLLAAECFKVCVEYPILSPPPFLLFLFAIVVFYFDIFTFACEVIKQEKAIAKLLDEGYPLSQEDFEANDTRDLSKYGKSIHIHLLKFEVYHIIYPSSQMTNLIFPLLSSPLSFSLPFLFIIQQHVRDALNKKAMKEAEIFIGVIASLVQFLPTSELGPHEEWAVYSRIFIYLLPLFIVSSSFLYISFYFIYIYMITNC